MSTATTVALTVLVLGLVLIAVFQNSRTVGPLINLGVLVGLAVGIAGTWLTWHASA